MSVDNKKKYAFWMRPETKDRVVVFYKKANCDSQSEFIEKAVNFYCGYLSSQNAHDYLPVSLESMISGIMQNSDHRMSGLLFRLAVEQCMMMHVIAETTELSDNYLTKLRGRCVKEVKKSIGSVKFDAAVRTHDEFNNE